MKQDYPETPYPLTG